MDVSVFMDKAKIPSNADLQSALGHTYATWEAIRSRVLEQYPKAQAAWYHAGAKFGWSFRMKDSKRAIVYLLPRDGYFKASLIMAKHSEEYKAPHDTKESQSKTLIKTLEEPKR